MQVFGEEHSGEGAESAKFLRQECAFLDEEWLEQKEGWGQCYKVRLERWRGQFTWRLEALARKNYGFIQKELREEAERSAGGCCSDARRALSSTCGYKPFLPDRPALLCQAQPLPISCTTQFLSFCGQCR